MCAWGQVVDVDYHAGNGGMQIHWNDPSVLFASLHMNPEVDYPFCAGFADQTGGPDAVGATINVPLQPGTTWATYKAELAKVLGAVTAFGAKVASSPTSAALCSSSVCLAHCSALHDPVLLHAMAWAGGGGLLGFRHPGD